MAYYSGQAASFSELLNVLVNACVEQGWIFSNGILNKGNVFIKPSISNIASPTYAQDNGLVIQGATGFSQGSLVNASLTTPRMGRASYGASYNSTPTFPVSYSLHILNNPDEVFFIVKHNIDRFIWLAFGQSTIDPNGLWIAANARFGGNGSTPYNPSDTTGGATAVEGQASSSGMMFWESVYSTGSNSYGNQSSIYFNGVWRNGCMGMRTIHPMISLSPSNFNQNAPLLPIQPILSIESSKVVIVANLQHIKYLKINNYEPEQIISLGNDKWKVYPGHKKVFASSVNGADHTSTYGHAVRYDGP